MGVLCAAGNLTHAQVKGAFEASRNIALRRRWAAHGVVSNHGSYATRTFVRSHDGR